MTAPRQVIAGRTYMVTRRCTQRMFLLKPDEITNRGFLYCLALAAQRYQVDVYAFVCMSNHPHENVGDKLGNLPEFTRYFHSLLARYVNCCRGRWENLWATEQCGQLHLADPEAAFDKMIYGLTNPVKAYLVAKAAHWPGPSSLAKQLSGKPIVVKRPVEFFVKNGDLPKQVTLEIKRLPGFEHLSDEQWRDKIRNAVAKVEAEAERERAQKGIKIVGRKAILRQSAFSQPKTIAARRAMVPRVATRNKWLRIELLTRNKAFEAEHANALSRVLAGERVVTFPFGTYRAVKLGMGLSAPAPT